AVDDGDLRLGVDGPGRVEPGRLRGDRIAERLRPEGDRLIVVVGGDGFGGGRLELRRAGEVGEALGEADLPGGDRQAVHLADDGLGEGLRLAADPKHGANSRLRPWTSTSG